MAGLAQRSIDVRCPLIVSSNSSGTRRPCVQNFSKMLTCLFPSSTGLSEYFIHVCLVFCLCVVRCYNCPESATGCNSGPLADNDTLSVCPIGLPGVGCWVRYMYI